MKPVIARTVVALRKPGTRHIRGWRTESARVS